MGAPKGNQNAKKEKGRIVLSLSEEFYAPLAEGYQKEHGREPDEATLKAAIKNYLRSKPIFHLFVDVHKENALKVERELKRRFGDVRACYLLDSFVNDSDSPERKIYYQHAMYDPLEDVWEDFEKEDVEILTEEEVQEKLKDFRQFPGVLDFEWQINDSPAMPR